VKAILLCALACLSAAAKADVPPGLEAALAPCRAITEAAARLACYDALGRPRQALPGERPSATVEPRPSAQPPGAAAAPAQAAAASAADFGLPQVRVPAQPEMIESRILGRFEGWNPGTRLRLANGQVWEVLDSRRSSYDLESPAVRVKRGLLGSFFIEIDGVSATPRVRRLQ
jgi:hypothetical protein